MNSTKATTELAHKHVIVMGVSSCGKSTVGKQLGESLGLVFRDGDDMHPAANIEKMSAGHALNDADRWPWLEAIGQWMQGQTEGAIVGCSALKRSYRDLIRTHAPDTVFVHLHGSYELLLERMQNRAGHFMPVSLLQSQFETLEELGEDEPGIVLDVAQNPAELTAEAAEYLRG